MHVISPACLANPHSCLISSCKYDFILEKAFLTWSPSYVRHPLLGHPLRAPFLLLLYTEEGHNEIIFCVICLHSWTINSMGVRSLYLVYCGIPSSLYTAWLIADVQQLLNEWMVDLSPKAGGRTAEVMPPAASAHRTSQINSLSLYSPFLLYFVGVWQMCSFSHLLLQTPCCSCHDKGS